MNDYILDETYFKLKLIGIYQVIGGIIGIGLMIWLITMVWPMPPEVVFVVAGSILLFLYSIACGISLYLKWKFAITLSIILQALQVASFTFLNCTFKYLAGLGLLVKFNFKDHLSVQVEPGYPLVRFIPYVDSSDKILSINIVAILLIYFLFSLRRKLYPQTSAIKISD